MSWTNCSTSLPQKEVKAPVFRSGRRAIVAPTSPRSGHLDTETGERLALRGQTVLAKLEPCRFRGCSCSRAAWADAEFAPVRTGNQQRPEDRLALPEVVGIIPGFGGRGCRVSSVCQMPPT
jgi:hypothetical protein